MFKKHESRVSSIQCFTVNMCFNVLIEANLAFILLE